MRTAITKFLLKCLLYILPIGIGFEALFRLGYHPLVTSSFFFDYKTDQLRQEHPDSLRWIAIGSSCGLFDLNSAVLTNKLDPSFYNFSSYGLQLTDIGLLLPDMVDHYRPQYVILCSSPFDFMTPPNKTYGNYTSMPFLIRDHFPEVYYFRPFNSIHTVLFRKLETHHPPVDHWGGVAMTFPTDRIHKKDWTPLFTFPTAETPAAYKALDTLAAWLHNRRIPLIFAEMPVNLVFDNASQASTLVAQHIGKCRSIVTAHGGILLNYQDPAIFPDSLFFDQTHLQAAGGEILTKKLVADLKKIIK